MTDAIFALIEEEKNRQQETLGMIPSENIASKAVRKAVGSVLMNKYAEGQVGARYYQGNAIVDEVEGLCKRRALQLFDLDPQVWGVNVQSLSGSPANLAVYNALLEPGDKILSMFLPDGGHLSHGWHIEKSRESTKGTEVQKQDDKKIIKPISIVSKFWQIEFYKTDPASQLFNYDQILAQARQFRPRLIVSGGTAYPREIDHERMAAIAQKVGAYYLADVSHEAGLIAGGVNASPFPYADVVMMTTHKTLRGPRGALIFSRRKHEIRNLKFETNSKSKNLNIKHQILNNERDLSSEIDFSVFPSIQGGPHLHTIAGIAVALAEAQTAEFKNYSAQIVTNAKVLAQGLIDQGFNVVSHGTDKHLVLVDLRDKKLTGFPVAWALEAAGIIVNKNTVPQETAGAIFPSGIRLGTPLITSRGLKEKEIKQIVEWIVQVVEEVKDAQLPKMAEERKKFVAEFPIKVFENQMIKKIKQEVKEMCERFPIE